MNVYEKIAAQQGKTGTTVWLAGEQLKSIITGQPEMEEIVLQDLDRKEMSLSHAEKEIKAFADKRHKEIGGNCVGVAPWEAEGILRKFYGLPERGVAAVPVMQTSAPQVHTAPPQMPQTPVQPDDALIDLDAFL